jgi:hypothetical protein
MRRLSLEMRGMDDLPTWQDALDCYLLKIDAEKESVPE